jgi:multicomponent Na+:H+ antiporter subunit G
MDMLINIASWVLIISGCMFCLIGGLGLIRLPDMFARKHGASLIDTMGIGLILIGLMFQAGFTLITAKLILILIFVFFTSPTSTHALARAAINGDLVAKVENDDGTKQEAGSSKT